MLDYDPIASLRHFPIMGGMKRFGQAPMGDAMYRVVFAPSRRYLVVGEWPDGSNCAQWVPKHKNLGNVWILERWRPAEEICPLGKEYWDLHHSILGPWPHKGDYELCHTFVAPPSDANIGRIVQDVEQSRTIRFAETLAWHRRDAEKEVKDRRSMIDDRIRNLLPAFGSRPFSGRVSRRTPTPLLRTAEELGLPTKGGFSVKPKPGDTNAVCA
jgi:hypothetical protein